MSKKQKRLIDADALKDWFLHCVVRAESTFIAERIDKAPTIDAEEVVRCKDCEYYVDELDYDGQNTGRKRCEHPKLDYSGFCDDFWLAPDPDDFCSYGKKR